MIWGWPTGTQRGSNFPSFPLFSLSLVFQTPKESIISKLEPNTKEYERVKAADPQAFHRHMKRRKRPIISFPFWGPLCIFWMILEADSILQFSHCKDDCNKGAAGPEWQQIPWSALIRSQCVRVCLQVPIDFFHIYEMVPTNWGQDSRKGIIKTKRLAFYLWYQPAIFYCYLRKRKSDTFLIQHILICKLLSSKLFALKSL